MLLYFLMLIPPLIASWFRPAKKPQLTPGLAIYFLVLLVFMGLRDRTGPDWYGYLNIYQLANLYSGFEGIDFGKTEVAFLLLNRLSDAVGTGLYGVNFVCTFIFLFGIFSFALVTARPWLAIAMVVPYLGFIIGMSGIRQAAAIGIASFALSRWARLSVFSKLAFIAVASEFHTASLVMLIFVLFEGSGWLWLRILAVGVVATVLASVSAGRDAVETYNARYVANDLISHGSAAHILLNAAPGALYLLVRRRLERVGLSNRLVAVASVGSILGLPLSLLSSTGVDRLTLFFSFVQMWTYPAVAAAYPSLETPVIGLSVLAALFIFFVYFTLGVTVSGFVPYHTILVSDW